MPRYGLVLIDANLNPPSHYYVGNISLPYNLREFYTGLPSKVAFHPVLNLINLALSY